MSAVHKVAKMGSVGILDVAGGRTLADRLRLSLADEIMRGEIAPGVSLDETTIAKRFQVSRTPVREAIRLLAASGLVEVRPHRSAVVARPTENRLLEMFEALRELEGLCAGLAAERMTRGERVDLEALSRSHAGIVRANDPERYHEANEAFHAAIYRGAHNAYLMELTAATRARIAPFSRAQFKVAGRPKQSNDEHKQIVQAIARGDSAKAIATMRAHISIVHTSFAGQQGADQAIIG
jgi:DNA-binding GntR family transcriptional regulator